MPVAGGYLAYRAPVALPEAGDWVVTVTQPPSVAASAAPSSPARPRPQRQSTSGFRIVSNSELLTIVSYAHNETRATRRLLASPMSTARQR